MIDLRSDGVTRPSLGMREAMARAPVGDDQFGDDPSTNMLQERVATLMGKEAALFVPSGTMANQIAIKLLTSPGDDVIVGTEAHVVWHESGASACNAGVQFTAIGTGGTFTASEFQEACNPRGHVIFPPTSLVVIENTHNRCGGLIFAQSDVMDVYEAAQMMDVGVYLDGARLFNVSAVTNLPLADLAAPSDVVSVSLSKGLCCPVGSVLAGPRDLIRRGQRLRRMFGGAMRQSGILASAGLYALDAGFEHLVEDHRNAKLISQVLGQSRSNVEIADPPTNIIVIRLPPASPDADALIERASAAGVLVGALAARTLRLVTHRDVDAAQCRRAAEVLAAIMEDLYSC